jgi:hypothetical protein
MHTDRISWKMLIEAWKFALCDCAINQTMNAERNTMWPTRHTRNCIDSRVQPLAVLLVAVFDNRLLRLSRIIQRQASAREAAESL